jgi:hypothetical protein
LNFSAQFFIIKTFIAIKDDAIDDRIFSDIDNQSIAAPIKRNIGKQARGKQAFQAVVKQSRIKGIADPDRKIRDHRGGFDPLYPPDGDTLDPAFTNGKGGWRGA